jgi:predicted ester cyclase
MSEDLKAMAKRFNDEVLSKGDLGVIDELVSDDFVEHEEFPGLPPGKPGLKEFVTSLRTAFPDLEVETLAVVAEGDEVWCHSRCTGTHQGEFAGVAPTGKAISISMIDRVKVRDGMVVEHWGVTDELTMMTQLGVVPEMG